MTTETWFFFLMKWTSGHFQWIMLVFLSLSIFCKFIMYYNLWSETHFLEEFEKRVRRHLEGAYKDTTDKDFSELLKVILGKTYHEIYVAREKYRRRKLDPFFTTIDKIFMVPQGVQGLIEEIVFQSKYFEVSKLPNFSPLIEYILKSNPYFSKILGGFSMKILHKILEILPKFFMLGGLLGGVLGLGVGMTQLQEAGEFTWSLILGKISLSLVPVGLGIIFSLFLSLLNILLPFRSMYQQLLNQFTSSLELLWKDCHYRHQCQDRDFHDELPDLPSIEDVEKKSVA